MYKISVIIPTYNREKTIAKSINSVLCQKGQGRLFDLVDIHVIDDNSSDNTRAVVEKLDDKRISFHKMERNSGAAAARNTGVSLAMGEWIAFQDSDDIWHEEKILKQVGFLKDNPEVSMVSHPIRAFFEDGSKVITETVNGEDMVPFLAEKNYYGTPTMLVNIKAFREIGGFDERLKALEDWDFSLRLADNHKIGMIMDGLIDSDYTKTGLSSSAANYYESRCRMIAWNKDILMKHGCFDTAVRSLLVHADKNGLFKTVGRILELSLMGGDFE